MNTTTPQPGHNLPPATPPSGEELQTDLDARNDDIAPRLAELLKSWDELPSVIKDDDTNGKAQALLKMMRETADGWDERRENEKKPWQHGVNVINNFFKTPIERLTLKHTGVIPQLRDRITDFLDRKKEKARLEAEAEAKRKRDDADRLLREAKGRERAALEAIGEAWAKDEAARAAAWKRQLAEGELWAAEIERDMKAANDRDAFNKSQDAIAEATAKLTTAKADEREAHKDTKTANKAATKAGREVKAATSVAARADKQAGRAEDRAEAPESALSRSRGEHGTVGFLARRWKVKSVDHAVVDLERLRGYFKPEHVDSAAYRYMMDNSRENKIPELKGCVFERETDAAVR